MPHPYRKLPVPSDAPFKLRPYPGKGWGAQATRFIATGDVILIEKPLFVISKPWSTIWEIDIWQAVYELPPDQRKLFFCLRDNGSFLFKTMLDAWDENMFIVKDLAIGLFLVASRFNHACVPNAKVSISLDNNLTLFAIRDILAGEEITFCYDGYCDNMNARERHQKLRFACSCRACVIGFNAHELSNTRRQLIRDLQTTSETPGVLLSTRWICCLLMACMLEAELRPELDQPFFGATIDRLSLFASWFKTATNSRIVSRAMTEGTWIQRLIVACSQLHRLPDIADETATVRVQSFQQRLLEERS